MKMSKQADYGNWVPAAMMRLLWGMSAACVVLTLLVGALWKNAAVAIILGILAIAMLLMSAYMQRCSDLFAFEKGGVMGEVHQFLMDHFDWKRAAKPDGSGSILDIGCGAAALTNRCAKTFPKARVTGMDYWGAQWSYAKEQCEQNAKLEGVSDRTSFVKGDAAKLDFPDERFDGAISNFVFHEVRSAKDKRDVVREALRVVKRGGAFAFQDMFGQSNVYGDMNEFIAQLKSEGAVREIHYIADIENQPFVPKFVTAPWMIRHAGLIYGIK